ncbi:MULTISPECIES: NADH-quinone oxidoreductase subunit NuoK [Streptomyces]|uniref:NADH-quinone oxidoreductase subunit K n=1 Tax=Streptomyces albus TaxID=1888 RepID=A0A6C1BY69_9ACTN|nr:MULTISPECIES: NADH-quinone oxidoreductase subunit NuoK [Streptomyces]KPC91637.1 NADH-ubiquinone oxidoreductase [Streptomyces sp. NRRL F-6602]EPD97096.1 hypothetical protein HMPREF1486_00327 [Streptomyces sp. HPH0547]QID34851.1 NADH-quinone oxidoreductase subunit NuoK [Streptomyces albus]TGG74676.1 NADH-quinone oxidoreductase subunit NuoK [Streptomyces albus]UVN58346.1 NADH-quinone oxidoreductase subunit NuoK [Streptomyces albus]
MTLETTLLVAAALFCVGLFGALTQQSVVMLMMGLELMLGGVILGAAGVWRHLSPTADGQVLIVLAVTVMAVEMAVGFAVVTALFRTREADMTDMAAELRE